MHGSALTPPQEPKLAPLNAQDVPWLVLMHRASPEALEPEGHKPSTGALPDCFLPLTGRPAPPAKIRAKRPSASAWHAQNRSQRHLDPSQNSARQKALLPNAAAMARVVRFFCGFSSSNRVLTHSVPPGFSEAKCFNCHDLRVHNSLYFLMKGILRNFCY